MIVDVSEIEESTRPFEFSISPGELDLEDPTFRLTGDIRATGQILKRTAQIDLQGSISAPAEIDCMRCLEPVSHVLAIDFDVNFVTPEHFASDKEREVSPEDLDTDVLDSDRIELTTLIREQILLNLPEQLFCRPDCKGLCLKCGANRNLIDCKCKEKEIDPRWAALKDLK